MYYPYLRGKQFELILLRDNAKFIALNKINPIIEPVKSDFKALKRALYALNEKRVNYTLIINPKSGQKPVKQSSILELINNNYKRNKNLSIGYILNANSNLTELAALIERYNHFSFTILHYGYTNGKQVAKAIDKYINIKNHIFIEGYAGKLYQRHLKKKGTKRILIRDGFKQQIKNSQYPKSEHFSELHITYNDEGMMDGFGDFLIVGDNYSETGGPAYAVAIHLTYLNNENDMYIFHFVSDQKNSPTDPGGKFLEALEKLVQEFHKPKSSIYDSDAINEFQKLYDKQHYPGLGFVKKLSMQHHIELIGHILNQEY